LHEGAVHEVSPPVQQVEREAAPDEGSDSAAGTDQVMRVRRELQVAEPDFAQIELLGALLASLPLTDEDDLLGHALDLLSHQPRRPESGGGSHPHPRTDKSEIYPNAIVRRGFAPRRPDHPSLGPESPKFQILVVVLR